MSSYVFASFGKKLASIERQMLSANANANASSSSSSSSSASAVFDVSRFYACLKRITLETLQGQHNLEEVKEAATGNVCLLLLYFAVLCCFVAVLSCAVCCAVSAVLSDV